MITRRFIAWEKVAAGLAAASTMAIGVHFLPTRPGDELGRGDTVRQSSADREIPQAHHVFKPLDSFVARWSEPVGAEGEEGYDLFSAPHLIYDAELRTYRVQAASRAGNAGNEGTLDPALVPFRLQLVGYVGGRDNLRGVFENVATGETIVAGRGRRIASLGLVVEEVALARAGTTFDADATCGGNLATAILADERDGRLRVALTIGVRAMIASLAVTDSQNEPTRSASIEQPRVVSWPRADTVDSARALSNSTRPLGLETEETNALRAQVAPTSGQSDRPTPNS